MTHKAIDIGNPINIPRCDMVFILKEVAAYLVIIFRFAGQEHINEKCQSESDHSKADKNQIIQNMTSQLISEGCARKQQTSSTTSHQNRKEAIPGQYLKIRLDRQ
jgi:hypothetical protein